MTFINGVRTTRTVTTKTTTTGLDYSVIGLIGTAPVQLVDEDKRTINTPVLITTASEGAEYFGTSSSSYTIPAALDAIFARLDSAKVIVVNVFDPDKHVVENDDGDLAASPDAVTISDIIGGTDSSTNARTGLEAFKDALQLCQYKPRILIAPEYSADSTVADALDTLAANFRARAYCDKSAGMTVKGLIASKSSDISSENIDYVYPRVKVYNSDTEEYEYRPASPYAAATRVYTNTVYGMHYSIGNQPIKGIAGLETPVYFDLQDENSDSNLINAQGYTTIIYSSGYRFWGNRNSSYPDNEDVTSFSTQVDIANYIDESIAEKSRQFMSGPITTAMIDDVVNFGNDFMANLKLNGWLINYDCYYDSSKNTYQTLAAGKMTITRRFLAPVPLEDLEYESEIDITLYTDLYSDSSDSGE